MEDPRGGTHDRRPPRRGEFLLGRPLGLIGRPLGLIGRRLGLIGRPLGTGLPTGRSRFYGRAKVLRDAFHVKQRRNVSADQLDAEQ